MGAKVQSYGGKPWIKRNATLGATTEYVEFPNPAKMAQAAGTYPGDKRPGKSVSITVSAVSATVTVNFDKDGTHFLTIPVGTFVRLTVEAPGIWVTGTAAGSGYEMLVELSHG